MLVDPTCSILRAATEAGLEWALENPCDRGLPVAHGGRRDLYSDPRHGSIWQMPAVIELAQHASCHTATFPLCHFGADWQKFTTLMFTPGLQRLLELDGILCSHQTHKQRAGGAIQDGKWVSAAAAAYPRELNIYIAQTLYHLSDNAPNRNHQGRSPGLAHTSEPVGSNQPTMVAPLRTPQPKEMTADLNDNYSGNSAPQSTTTTITQRLTLALRTTRPPRMVWTRRAPPRPQESRRGSQRTTTYGLAQGLDPNLQVTRPPTAPP